MWSSTVASSAPTEASEPDAHLVAVVAACSALAGALHLLVAWTHADLRGLAALFVGTALVQLCWAAVLALRPPRLLVVVGTGLQAAFVGFYLLTRMTGVPIVDGLDGAQPVAFVDVVTTLLGAAAACGGVLLLQPSWLRLRRPLRLGPQVTAGVLAVLLLAAAPAMALSTSHDHGSHSHGEHDDHVHGEGGEHGEHEDDGHGHSPADGELAAGARHHEPGEEHGEDGHDEGTDHGHEPGADHVDPQSITHDDGEHAHDPDPSDTGDHPHPTDGTGGGHPHPAGGGQDHPHPAGGGQDHPHPAGGGEGHLHPIDGSGGGGGHQHPGGGSGGGGGHPHPTAPQPGGGDEYEYPSTWTAQQVAFADDLRADTEAALPRFAKASAAVAAGFIWIGDGGQVGGYRHYINLAWIGDSRILDPAYPESLVYLTTASGPVLQAAMYMLPFNHTVDDIPTELEWLPGWHIHENLCFRPNLTLGGLKPPGGSCPPGTSLFVTPPMMHVWIAANGCGPFAGVDEFGLQCGEHEH